MPAPYSYDLRQKILTAFETGDYTADEIAEMFNVHRTYPYKMLRQLRETGTVEPLPHGGGQSPKLKTEHQETLKKIVKEAPDATLEQLREQIKEKTEIEVSSPTICRILKKLKISLKKRRGEPRKQTRLNEKNSKSSRQN